MARVPLELLKLLLGASSLGDLEHIESHSLSQGPALSNSDNVSNLYIPETGGQVHRHVLVTLLKAIVLSDVMEIVPADDNGPLHLHLRHDTWESNRKVLAGRSQLNGAPKKLHLWHQLCQLAVSAVP